MRPGFKGHPIEFMIFGTPIWDPYGPILTHLDLLRLNSRIWTNLVHFGKVWTNLDPFGSILTYLDLFGQVWGHLEQFRALWTSLDAIGPIESVSFLSQEVA